MLNNSLLGFIIGVLVTKDETRKEIINLSNKVADVGIKKVNEILSKEK